MYKRSIYLAILATFTCLGIYLFVAFVDHSSPKSGYCAFCDPKVLAAQTFYEDDAILVLYTHKPVVPGHCLITPKRHVERFEDLSDREIMQFGRVMKEVNRAARSVFGISSYLILQKNGREVGQTVPHVHFHYMPRQAGDDSQLVFLTRLYLASLKKPISAPQMKEIVGRMRREMSNRPNCPL